MQRKMWVPVAVLGAVVALIATLVVLGEQEQRSEEAGENAEQTAKTGKAKAGKAKGRPKEAALNHQNPIAEDRAAAPEGAPNVVLVIVNALRRDQIEAYGGPADTMPYLTGLSKRGALFTDALATAPWNKPAVLSMLSGHHAISMGMIEPGPAGNKRILAQDVTLLPERLQDKGWYTVGISANFNANVGNGMAQGFDRYRDSVPMSFVPPGRLDAKASVPRLFKMLDERPEGAEGRPVYAQLLWVDAHKPIMVKPEEFSPFEGEGHKIAPYRAVIHRVDVALENLVSGLAERGMTPENTLLMVVADHGEGLLMPQHHGKQHGRTLFQSVISIPWVVTGPGVKPGHRVDGVASQVDLTPTVMGLLGMALEDDGMPGKDLSGAVRGDQKQTGRDVAYVDSWYFTANNGAVYSADRVCQQDFGTSAGAKIVSGCYSRIEDMDGRNVQPAAEDDALMGSLVAWRTDRVVEYEAWPAISDAP